MNVKEINELIEKEKALSNISIKEISDGHHTFGELYRHRIILFCTICNLFPEISFKSWHHFDEEIDPMYDDSFICGISTPSGIATYHAKKQYWELFNIPEISKAPKYDNYTGEEVLQRLLSLSSKKQH